MKNLSTPKKRFNAPAAFALAAVILIAASILSVGIYIGSQGATHSKMPQRSDFKTSQTVDIDQLREDLTQGRI